MVYLVIKELSTIAEDVIMVTSSIMKDMQPNLEVVYRPNAIRALARIIDVGYFLQFWQKNIQADVLGAICSVRRTVFQISSCRPLFFHLLRIPCIFLSPIPPFTGYNQAMVKRSPRSRQRQSRLKHLLQRRWISRGWWRRFSRVFGGSEHELYHAVSRAGPALSHQGER